MPNTAAPTASERPFIIIELISQSSAIQRHLAGCTEEEILAWLGRRGKLRPHYFQGQQVGYFFCSHIGFSDCFFFRGGKLVFVLDHFTWSPD